MVELHKYSENKMPLNYGSTFDLILLRSLPVLSGNQVYIDKLVWMGWWSSKGYLLIATVSCS